ncbi:trimeric intracellular cation channel family protein [Rubellimicrobium roseum]|uniref:Trimeric intracellular cation channel family protein n=1 Tax=Rubellimicrobium roseum TaxID=687525 RepID=A0A5C4NGY1_9RHOB|nr:trimeric intracellular cation channel family protein [Rubellimicrobium roseum]TNC73863.1 trimeric intracellular cation channel family protein [Rubellimicrobium roseum]
MPVSGDAATLALVLDLLGTFVFGLSGGTLAVRRGLDIIGVLVLSTAAALAGGMARDVLLGATPVAALADSRYLLAALVAGLAAFLGHPLVERLGKPVMVFDALGLGLFAVTGCRKALAYGMDPLPSLLLGVVTAAGGGVLRDLLVAEVPRVLRGEIYALAALLGAGVVVLGDGLGLPAAPVTLAGVGAAFLLRLVSVRRGWDAPRSPWS